MFAAIGIWSLWHNGSSVADGGFIEVMLATRGDTEMDRLVITSGIVTTNDMSKELKELKVRYGELVNGEVGEEKGRFGFGTAKETRSLRR